MMQAYKTPARSVGEILLLVKLLVKLVLLVKFCW